jgi:uncharacterized protein (TIGR02444 family)
LKLNNTNRLDIPVQTDHFWQFAVTIYSLEPVKQCCLDLQNEHDANVNLILLCIYLDRHNCQLSVEQIGQLQHSIEQSNEELKNHRGQRQALKKSKVLDQEALILAYQTALSEELELEREQQYILVTCLNNIITSDLALETSIKRPNASVKSLSNTKRYLTDLLAGQITSNKEQMIPKLQAQFERLVEYV